MRAFRAVTLFMLVASCGGSTGGPTVVDVPPVSVSGARLRATWWTPPEGPRLFIGWHDTQLGQDCRPQMAADGVLRCMPLTGVTAGGLNEYLDAACTQPVWADPQAPANTPFYVESVRGRCDVTLRLYRFGAPVVARTYGFDENLACVPVDEGQARPHVRLEEVTGQLAGFRVDTGPTVDGLAARVASAPDGTRYFEGWWDAGARRSCDFFWSPWEGPRLAADGLWRCLPVEDRSAIRSKYDFGPPPGCQSNTALVDPACAAEIVLGTDESTCPPRLTATGPLRQASCAADPPTLQRWSIGPLPPTSFPTGAKVTTSDHGRVGARWIETSVGRVLLGLWDNQLNVACAPALTVDGHAICQPAGAAGQSGYFADAACAQPIAVVNHVCEPLQYQVTTVQPDLSVEEWRLQAVHRLQPYFGPIFEHDDTALQRCQPADLSRPKAQGTDYLVGDEIPLDQLIPLQRTSD